MKLIEPIRRRHLLSSEAAPEGGLLFQAFLALAIALAIAFRLVYVFYVDFSWEDAFIHFRIAENIAEGKGFVYNSGERVLVSSAPLWTLALALFPAVGLSVEMGSKFVSIAADVGTMLLLAYFAKRFMNHWAAIFAVAIYGLNWSVVYWTTSGMETGLFTFVTLLGVYLYTIRRFSWMAVACGFMALIRPEGALMAGLLFLLMLRQEGLRYTLKYAAISLAIVGPWLLFAWAYFGSPVPNSVVAKLVIYVGTAGSLSKNFLVIRNSFLGDPFKTMATLVALAGLGTAVFWRVGPALLLATWMVLWYFSYWISQTAIFEWYLIPPYSAYSLLGGMGLALLGPLASRLRIPSRLRSWGLSLAAAGVLVALSGLLVQHIPQVLKTREVEYDLRVGLSQWIIENTPQDTTIAIEGIGVVGYVSERYILDLAGLASPEVLPYWESQTVPYWVNADVLIDMVRAFQPEYYVRQSVVTPLSSQAKAWLFQHYQPVAIGTRNGVVEAQSRPEDFQRLVDQMESGELSDAEVAKMRRYHIIYARVSG